MYSDILKNYFKLTKISKNKFSNSGGYSKSFQRFLDFCKMNNFELGALKDCKFNTIRTCIINDIDIPKCICGKITDICINNQNEIYFKRCSMLCRSNDISYTSKISNTKTKLYKNTEWKNLIESKKTATTMKNYGVNYPMQHLDIFQKQQSACFKKNENGFQGYEPFIYPLLKEIYEDIIIGSKYLKQADINIKWIGDDDKFHYSYPDFWIQSINSFIEIKSEYTYQLHHDKIMKCKDALNVMKYGYIIAIVHPKKSFIFQSFNLKYIYDDNKLA